MMAETTTTKSVKAEKWKTSCCNARLALSRNSSCAHLKAFKDKGGQENFFTIQQYLQSCSVKLLGPKSIKPSCFSCTASSGSSRRVHMCLQCVFVGCWFQEHLFKHFHETGHHLAVDITYNQIYCNLCSDYVYDPDFEFITTREKSNARMLSRFVTDGNPAHIYFSEWSPTKTEAEVMVHNAKLFTVPPHLLGLRGLHNLGNTCFVNCVLQAFLHNPLLRNYFLSDMHNRKACTQRTKQERNGVCLGCEMDYLFAEAYSGIRLPFSPHHFLFSIWKYVTYFAGYEQQDAHEFLISALNGLHLHCDGSPKDCNCIIHKTFSGVLRSDVSCAKCGSTSSAYDPFFDISLDLKRVAKNKDSQDDNLVIENISTLLECLNTFTRPERLENEEQFLCSKCTTHQDSIKQMSFHTLPLVLSFHLKRFEQPRHKLDHHVDFPEEIDLSPFKSLLLSKHSSRKRKVDELAETYKLFAVINHSGSMETGHYICHVRHHGSWIKCDDAWLTPSSLGEVLQTKGYMLFYIKQHLDFEKNEKPEKPPATKTDKSEKKEKAEKSDKSEKSEKSDKSEKSEKQKD